MLLEDKRRIAFESKKSLLAHKHPAEDNRGGNESEPAYCAASDQFAAAPAVPLLLLHVGRVSVLRRLQPGRVRIENEMRIEIALQNLENAAWACREFSVKSYTDRFPAMPWLS